MPIYEFACSACGHRFDELCSGPVEEKECPRCGARAKRRLAAFAFQSGGTFKSSSTGGCRSCGGGSCSTCGR